MNEREEIWMDDRVDGWEQKLYVKCGSQHKNEMNDDRNVQLSGYIFAQTRYYPVTNRNHMCHVTDDGDISLKLHLEINLPLKMWVHTMSNEFIWF